MNPRTAQLTRHLTQHGWRDAKAEFEATGATTSGADALLDYRTSFGRLAVEHFDDDGVLQFHLLGRADGGLDLAFFYGDALGAVLDAITGMQDQIELDNLKPHLDAIAALCARVEVVTPDGPVDYQDVELVFDEGDDGPEPRSEEQIAKNRVLVRAVLTGDGWTEGKSEDGESEVFEHANRGALPLRLEHLHAAGLVELTFGKPFVSTISVTLEITFGGALEALLATVTQARAHFSEAGWKAPVRRLFATGFPEIVPVHELGVLVDEALAED